MAGSKLKCIYTPNRLDGENRSIVLNTIQHMHVRDSVHYMKVTGILKKAQIPFLPLRLFNLWISNSAASRCWAYFQPPNGLHERQCLGHTPRSAIKALGGGKGGDFLYTMLLFSTSWGTSCHQWVWATGLKGGERIYHTEPPVQFWGWGVDR